jgi:hypothetical protein
MFSAAISMASIMDIASCSSMQAVRHSSMHSAISSAVSRLQFKSVHLPYFCPPIIAQSGQNRNGYLSGFVPPDVL